MTYAEKVEAARVAFHQGHPDAAALLEVARLAHVEVMASFRAEHELHLLLQKKRRFDHTIIFPDDIDALRNLTDGAPFNSATARLSILGLVDSTLYSVHPNIMGRVARAGIYEGARVTVQPTYHIDALHNRKGVVTHVSSMPSGVRIEVRLAGQEHQHQTWCFYECDDDGVNAHAISDNCLKVTSQFPHDGGQWSGHDPRNAKRTNTPLFA